MRKRQRFLALATILFGSVFGSQMAMAAPVVLELFTSQGCSSCPPADALMKNLLSDPSLAILSFHVNYWDNLGWKDPFASQDSTNRQYAYGKAMQQGGVFTPQLIINGTASMVGSENGKVRYAIAAAEKETLPVRVALSLDTQRNLKLTLAGANTLAADIWEARFVRHASTPIGAGENGGRTLESVNNVTTIKRLGSFAQNSSFTLPPLQKPDDGVAIIVQTPGPGKVLGSAVYLRQ